jgi:hypothetical protein
MYTPTLGKWMERDPIRNADSNDLYEYEHSSPITGLDPTGLYDEAGHYWTTYAVARIAGRSHDDAASLAFWSQAPDQVTKFDAIGVMLGGIFPPFWATDVHNYLHCLSGSSDPEHRRRILRDLLEHRTLLLWQRGFLIHALGDSYAHTHTNFLTGEQNAFPPAIAHAPSHDPDHIGDHPDKYIGYVRDLFGVLNDGRNRHASDNLETYIQFINRRIGATPQTQEAESRLIKDYLWNTYDDIPAGFLDAMVPDNSPERSHWDPLAGRGNMEDPNLVHERNDVRTMREAADLMDMIKRDSIP